MPNNINDITDKLQKINPQITEEYLELLYRYILTKLKDNYSFDKMIAQLKQKNI